MAAKPTQSVRTAALPAAAFLWLLAGPAAGETAAEPGAETLPAETRSGYEDESRLGRGPTDPSNEVLEADEERDSALEFPRFDALFEPWYAFKEDLNERIGLQFVIAETALCQKATRNIDKNDAAGGILEFTGTWTLINRDEPNQGLFGFKIENRHRFTRRRQPQNLAFEFGSAYSTAFGYAQFGFEPVELWWEQHLFDDRAAVRVGKQLPFAAFDYFSLKSPKTGFVSAPFTQNPTIAFPSFGLGAAAAIYPTKELYFVAGIHDANGRPQRTRHMFRSFFNDSDYFKAAELGWDPEFSIGKGSYHIMGWHADRREKRDIPEDWGLTLSGEQNYKDWLFFLRYGYSNDTSSVLKHMLAGGVALNNVLGQDNDVIALGLSWGKIASFDRIETEIAGERFEFDPVANRNQYHGELFYRLELTPRLTVTPNVQTVIEPAAENNKAVGVFRIRGRFAM